MPTIEDLIALAAEGNAVDFQDAVDQILQAKADEALEDIADSYSLGESVDPDEDDDLDDLADAGEDDELTDDELAEIAENITEEEFEQLDELSRKTLASYVRRSADSMATHHAELERARDNYSDGSNFGKGVPYRVREKADKIVRDDALARQNHHMNKEVNRHVGIKRATNRLAKD